jgi:polygalacturonase
MRKFLLAFPALSGAFGCAPLSEDAVGFTYQCGESEDAAYVVVDDHVTVGGGAICGEGDPNLPPEPRMPDVVCETLVADKTTPDESRLDTDRIQAALTACKGKGAVKLVADGANNTFLAGHLEVDSVILWVDKGVTLYGSRNPDLFQKTGSCGVPGASDSDSCVPLISVSGTNPGIVGDGVIDGQGGEPLVGRDYSWWQLSGALRSTDGSLGNPQMINLNSGTTGFLMYRITLYNAAKFHVKITSNPTDGTCDAPGEGYTVWGVTILTPSKLYNSQGLFMTPHFARNTDGIDPGTTNTATCGVIACNTVSTSDDQIAIKGGHLVKDLVIAHNHFGTGHGMSIGSETYGTVSGPEGVQRGVQNILIYDLTIDANTRSVGHDASVADFNGIRIKSDISRGGLVDNIVYRDICMRDMNNAILISTAYNPLFSGNYFPEFRRIEFQNVRHVGCTSDVQPVVTIEGHSEVRRAGPVKFDNVVIDNIGPGAVAAEYADIELGPGPVNFMPQGRSVNVANNVNGNAQPYQCVFPKLPAPEAPPGFIKGDQPH